MRTDFLTKVLPIIVSFATAYFSFSLSKQKSNREKEADQYKRLNRENDKLTKQIDHYRKLIDAKDKEIYDLRKELTRRYMAGAIQEPLLNAKNKEDKDDNEDVD